MMDTRQSLTSQRQPETAGGLRASGDVVSGRPAALSQGVRRRSVRAPPTRAATVKATMIATSALIALVHEELAAIRCMASTAYDSGSTSDSQRSTGVI